MNPITISWFEQKETYVFLGAIFISLKLLKKQAHHLEKLFKSVFQNIRLENANGGYTKQSKASKHYCGSSYESEIQLSNKTTRT